MVNHRGEGAFLNCSADNPLYLIFHLVAKRRVSLGLTLGKFLARFLGVAHGYLLASAAHPDGLTESYRGQDHTDGSEAHLKRALEKEISRHEENRGRQTQLRESAHFYPPVVQELFPDNLLYHKLIKYTIAQKSAIKAEFNS